MKLTAYAKINLFLSVRGRRPDGYHDIESVMQTVSLGDTVTVDAEAAEETEIALTVTDPALPTGEGNIAYRTARAFLDEVHTAARVRIHIEKNIPVAGGLAGGSTDGAAVLRGLNDIFGSPMGAYELCRIGARIGADVPFCIIGGTAATYGIGEIVQPTPPLPDCIILIVRPHESVSTAEAYRKIDMLRYGDEKPMGDMLSALGGGRLDGVISSAYNVFEKVMPGGSEVFRVKDALCSCGAHLAMMSGSGPSVFGIFEDASSAERAASALSSLGYDSVVSRPTIPAFWK